MKRVRFESPKKSGAIMNDSECHSPRPFNEDLMKSQAANVCIYSRRIDYSTDPLQRFQSSDSSPYPNVNKTNLPNHNEIGSRWVPSHELDLSMLDASNQVPRQPIIASKTALLNKIDRHKMEYSPTASPQEVLSSIENTKIVTPPNILSKDNFFIQRDNLNKFYLQDLNSIQKQLNGLSLGKENETLATKAELLKITTQSSYPEVEATRPIIPANNIANGACKCHHCIRMTQNNTSFNLPFLNKAINSNNTDPNNTDQNDNYTVQPGNHKCNCIQIVSPKLTCTCCEHNIKPIKHFCSPCSCGHLESPLNNAVDKKGWAIQRYEQSNSRCTDMRKQIDNNNDKREPTVADLFKIIKMQNEQLQLLQEKVDKFISANNNATKNLQTLPIQNYVTEQLAVKTVDNEHHKISIGVMTSFEVRTSTIINNEVVKQTNDAQLQCNRSQISIKEVFSKSQPMNLNFLDGISPVEKVVPTDHQENARIFHENAIKNIVISEENNINEEKTLNELSLYNVEVDNATTPLMSPDQSLYLDVRDYSDSDSSSDDQSNVGWTYYNKVMTHVNGLLQDSDMPSSASALHRNTRQHCMQIDKTNVSVTKRVKFGDDPLGIHQPHIYAAATDTSLKMNQLAAKYLKKDQLLPIFRQQEPKAIMTPIDMSFATKNYMERHKLLQALPPTANDRPHPMDIPKFLDITHLKQQPKLL